MNKIFKNAAMAVMALCLSTAAFAQEVDYEAPYNFVGVKGGAQATLTHYNFMDLVTPQYGIYFGRYFNQFVGARLDVTGYQNKGGFRADRYDFVTTDTPYKFNACTADLDLLMNMTNILNPTRANHAFNWNLLAGFGVNYTWNNDEFNAATNSFKYYVGQQLCEDRHASFNGRLGTQLEYNVAKNFSVMLEADANYKNDQYNLKFNDRCDWQVQALVGLTYKFGYKVKKVEVPEEVWAVRTDTIWYDDTEYKTKVVTEEFTCDDHFQICQSKPVSESVITKVTDFCKTYKNVRVSVTGYADKGTGNPRVNMKYSQQRAESVAEALKNAGVPEAIMTVDWKGDTVQPFAENDENRAAIVKVSGETEQKYPVTVKKFRTQDVRYRVR